MNACRACSARTFPSTSAGRSVKRAGGGISNGALLTRAARDGFDVFLTVDKNLRHQQNVKKLPIAVVVVHVRNNDYDEVRPFVPRIEEVLAKIQPCELVVIE